MRVLVRWAASGKLKPRVESGAHCRIGWSNHPSSCGWKLRRAKTATDHHLVMGMDGGSAITFWCAPSSLPRLQGLSVCTHSSHTGGSERGWNPFTSGKSEGVVRKLSGQPRAPPGPYRRSNGRLGNASTTSGLPSATHAPVADRAGRRAVCVPVGLKRLHGYSGSHSPVCGQSVSPRRTALDQHADPTLSAHRVQRRRDEIGAPTVSPTTHQDAESAHGSP